MFKHSFIAAAALAMSSSLAQAADPSWSASLGGASDYVFRGVSQTDENPFAFIAVNAGLGDFYAGAGAENVDFNNSIDAEYDFWAGWHPTVAGLSVDLGIVRYGYIDQPSGVDLDTLEYKLGLGKTLGDANVGANVLYTTDYFGSDNAATYGELTLGYALTPQWSASGVVGRQTVDGGVDYTTWNAGIAYAPLAWLALDVRYHDTNVHELGKIFDSRVVGTVKLTFAPG